MTDDIKFLGMLTIIVWIVAVYVRLGTIRNALRDIARKLEKPGPPCQ